MFVSMTGFGAAQHSFDLKRGKIQISVEIKSVNSKFLDLNLRSPRAYVIFDGNISKLVRQYLKRGRVDVTLTTHMLEGAEREVAVNISQAKVFYEGLEKVRKSLGVKTELSMAEVLEFPDFLQTKDVDVDEKEEWPLLEQVLRQALDKLVASRKFEGNGLHQIIADQKNKMSELYQSIRGKEDMTLASLRERLKERVKTLMGSTAYDPQRLEQEVTFWTAKSDFKEEMDRISQHFKSFDGLMAQSQEVGRKLDFLLQELHREVNTLGTKCSEAALTPTVIELKTCIERMREQIQNVE